MAHSASRASTDPAGDPGSPASSTSAQHPAELAALTGRDDFLLELGEVLSGRASVHPADSIEPALERLIEARGNRVLAIDTRDTGDVRANVARAAEQIPDLVILVFTEEQSEKSVAAALKGTKVFAVLPVPLEAVKTAAVLEAALNQANRSAPARHSPPHHATHDRSGGADAGAAQSDPQEPPTRRTMLWAGVGAAVVAVAAGAGWFLLHGKAPVPAAVRGRIAGHPHAVAPHAAALAQPTVDTSIVQGHVDDLLEKARHAMFERHFTTPRGANALVFYRSVLAVDPTNGEALDGLRRVGNVLISQFDGAMGHGHYQQAALALATLKVARPTDPRIASFQLKLYQAEISQALAGGHAGQAATLLAQAAQAGVPAAQLRGWQARLTQIQQSRKTQSLTAAIAASIRKDAFTGPTGALAQLAQLRTLAPKAPATKHAAHNVIKGLLAKAAQDARTGNSADESHWLDKARSIGASPKDIATFRQRLADARTQTKANRLLAQARARLDSGALTQPQNDSTAYYLTALEQTHPTGALLASERQVRGELAAKLLERAESEARAGKGEPAQADVAQARLWGASAADIRSARDTVAASLRHASQPSAADLRRLAASLVRTRYVAPSYPSYALDQRIAGEVTVQYVVDKKGVPRHVHVISARPSGVFDHSTLDAIRGWRYRPVKFHGHPVEVPVRTLIRYVLPN